MDERLAERLAVRLSESLATVRARIAAAAARADRDPAAVRILAVTKGQPAEALLRLSAAGLDSVGESRVQEAEHKRALLAAEPLRWELIGHLQRNKAAAAARLFDRVQSVDSLRIAAALAAERHRRSAPPAPLPILVEVELTGLAARTGTPAPHLGPLLRAIAAEQTLRVEGLMTIAPPGGGAAARACFRRLRTLAEEARDATGLPLPELSMGMSGDLEVAVEEGSTLVRIGTALFGARGVPPGRVR